MKKEQVASNKYINFKNNEILLKYYITECTNFNYGIAIESLNISQLPEILTDKVHTINISNSYVGTKNFIQMLSDYLVTPIALLEILEDFK